MTRIKSPSATSRDQKNENDLRPVSGKPRAQNQTPSLLSSLSSVAVVIASTLVVFAAFRNTLTWHLQRFWGASGDFWQSQWDRLIDNYGDDPRMLWTVGSTLISFGVYWGFGALYILLDVTNKPAFLRRYKVQPGTNEPVDRSKLKNAIKQVLVNQVIAIPFTYLSYSALEWRGMPPLRELPTFHWVLFELACFILVEEFAFYYSHRLVHHRLLYKHIHKQHHEWTAPIAVIATYCHPLEHLFSNITPPFLGVLVMGSHMATGWLWFTLVIINTLNDHSGYHWPFMSSPEYHDFHHLKYNQCYGVLGLLDRLHGTDSVFRESQAHSRHLMMFSLKPIREVFPDEEKCSRKQKAT